MTPGLFGTAVEPVTLANGCGARRKAASNVTVALACDDFKADEQLETGDFVVRGLVGASPTTGALLIAAEPRLGQRIKFLVSLPLRP